MAAKAAEGKEPGIMRLDGKTAVVTGAGSGIGRAVAETLAGAGAHVVATDIDEAGAAQTAAAARGAGGSAEARRLDVTDKAAILETAASLGASLGAAHVLANVAGWDRIMPFTENTPEFIERIVELNYLGAVRMCHALLPAMIEAGGGKIVSVSSDAGRVGSMGETVYAGTKGGVIAFSKSLARETARHNINVNVVCPGPTDTPLFRGQPERMQQALIRAIPFRRVGTPQDIANAVLFFAGPLSDYVTGQVLSVSGGLTMAD